MFKLEGCTTLDIIVGTQVNAPTTCNYCSPINVLSKQKIYSDEDYVIDAGYINDLPDYVKNNAKLFADDLKLIANAGRLLMMIYGNWNNGNKPD